MWAVRIWPESFIQLFVPDNPSWGYVGSIYQLLKHFSKLWYTRSVVICRDSWSNNCNLCIQRQICISKCIHISTVHHRKHARTICILYIPYSNIHTLYYTYEPVMTHPSKHCTMWWTLPIDRRIPPCDIVISKELNSLRYFCSIRQHRWSPVCVYWIYSSAKHSSLTSLYSALFW